MDNYTRLDARNIVADFISVGNPYPYGQKDAQRIYWEQDLVVYAMNQAHADGYKQREEGL